MKDRWKEGQIQRRLRVGSLDLLKLWKTTQGHIQIHRKPIWIAIPSQIESKQMSAKAAKQQLHEQQQHRRLHVEKIPLFKATWQMWPCKASENPWLLPLCLFLQQPLPYSFHPTNLDGVSLNPGDTDADYIHGLYFKERRSLFKDFYLKINVNGLIVKASHLQDSNDHSAATFISIPSVEPRLFCSGRRLQWQG